MKVVVSGPRSERHQAIWAPGDFIPGVPVSGLPGPDQRPRKQGQKVHAVLQEQRAHGGWQDGSQEVLDRVRVL
jgi:hypothetical protein